MHDAENGGIRTNAERKRQQHHGQKSRLLDEPPNGDPDVVQNGLHLCPYVIWNPGVPVQVFLMGQFSGGSAYGMAGQICEGYVVVNPMNLKRMSRGELGQLQFELQRVMTDLRAELPDQKDTQALQTRNRKISRVRQALRVIEHRMRGR